MQLCFALGGCGVDAMVRDNNKAAPEASIYVVSHGWHTGIIVESQPTLIAVPELAPLFHDARFIEFGWGDHDFYQAGEISYGLAIKALFLPTDAVLHVVGLPKHPKAYFRSSKVVEIIIPASGLAKMLDYFHKSFKRDRQGRFIRLGRGLYADSFFFRAHGAYYALYTCNSWVMEALTEAGLPESWWPTLTAEGVMDQVKRYRDSSNRSTVNEWSTEQGR